MIFQHKTEAEAIEWFMATHADDYIDFDGMNCNDYRSEDDINYCGGWQIGNRRCDCGNRRVSIETYGDQESGFVAYAAAW